MGWTRLSETRSCEECKYLVESRVMARKTAEMSKAKCVG